jgi:hypothetical protein
MLLPFHDRGVHGSGTITNLHLAGVSRLEAGTEPVHFVQSQAVPRQLFRGANHDLQTLRTNSHHISWRAGPAGQPAPLAYGISRVASVLTDYLSSRGHEGTRSKCCRIGW